MSLQSPNKTNDEIEKLLKINDLVYSPSTDLSVVSSKNYHKYHPTNGTSFGPGNTIDFQLSASNYIMGPKCWLEFDLVATSTAANVYFSGGQAGSVVNVLNSILWTNSDEIDRSELCNLRYYHEHGYNTTDDKTVHGIDTAIGHRQLANRINVKNQQRYAIPLHKVLPSFANGSQLIPLNMVAGSRLKITLENARTALFASAADTAITYAVTNPVIYLAEYKLQEAAEMRLNLHGSQSPGLVFSYESYTHQSSDKSGTQISRQVAPAVSHLVSIFTTNRPSTNIINEEVDSLGTVGMPLDDDFTYSYRLGSSRYPEEQVTKRVSAYMLAQDAIAPQTNGDNSVSYKDFIGETVNTHGVLAMTFNRSVTGGLSGVSLNSNSVQAWLDYSDNVGTGQTMDTFAKHVRACSVFSSGQISVNF